MVNKAKKYTLKQLLLCLQNKGCLRSDDTVVESFESHQFSSHKLACNRLYNASYYIIILYILYYASLLYYILL